MKNILKVVFVIIGTLIGAGFASGQEMYIFFFSHGIEGLFGILISCTLIGFIIYKTLKVVNQYNIKTYKEFLEVIIKHKSKNIYFNFKNMINIIVNIFILVTFFIMIAGFGAYFEQELGINNLIGSSVLAILCFTIFRKSVKGVVKANEILIPVLITSLTIIGLMNLKNIHFMNLQDYIIKTSTSNYILDAILYSSYNSILLIPVLITLRDYLKNNKQITIIATITTIISVILSICIFFILMRVDVDITTLEMPAVYVVSNMFKLLRYVYGFIILGSIFTTAISLGTSFLQNITQNKKSYTQIAVIMCITSVIVANFGFSNLVNLLYPIFGYIGFLQILKMYI